MKNETRTQERMTQPTSSPDSINRVPTKMTPRYAVMYSFFHTYRPDLLSGHESLCPNVWPILRDQQIGRLYRYPETRLTDSNERRIYGSLLTHAGTV